MQSPWFNVLVVVFWLVAMSWLVVEKVLPPLLIGEPPTYRTILQSQDQQGPASPVAWRIEWNESQVGTAATAYHRTPDEITEIRSHVSLDMLPLTQAGPAQLGIFSRLLDQGLDELRIDVDSTVEIDPLGRLLGMESMVRLGDLPDAIHLQGTAEESRLRLTLRAGAFVYTTYLNLSSGGMVGDALTPDSYLPNLRLGQSWTVPVYSPFRPALQPMEVLEAHVDREEMIVWNGQLVRTRVVVYRSDEGAGLNASRQPRGAVWVARDGTVLEQRTDLLGTSLRFVRLPHAAASADALHERADALHESTSRLSPEVQDEL